MSGGIDVSVSLSQIMDVASQDTPVSFVGVAMQVVFDEYQGGHDEHQGALVEYNGDHDEHQGDHEVLDDMWPQLCQVVFITLYLSH